MLEVINEPIFPAKITAVKVGANSNTIDWRVAKPMRYLGINGLSIFKAVCTATTPPTKKEIKATIPIDPKMRSSISRNMRSLVIDQRVRLRKTS